MKISDAQTFVVANPPPHFGGPYFVFVKLTTDHGVTGIGEAYCAPFGPATVADMISDTCERFVIGSNPFDIEALWRRIYSAGYTQRPDVSMGAVLSAIEMACWDVVGKETNQPVYNLLGGRVRERLRTYTYLYPSTADGTDDGTYSNPARAAERAAHYADLGFTAIKFDPTGPYTAFDPRQLSLEALDRSEALLGAVRDAVGSRVDLLFGTHGQMSPAGAIRLARRLERFDPMWFEEPTPPDHPDGMAQVAAATSIPVATGERLTTKYEFAAVLRAKAAAILQPNLGRCGGILEAKKIAAIGETYHAQIAPHVYCGPVVAAAAIQLATSIPNFLILEGIERWGGFHAEILKNPITWEDGYVVPPDAPGLGVELDEEVANAHPYGGDALHLNSAGSPEDPQLAQPPGDAD